MSNSVGIEANVAYYGFGLIIFTVFNMLFFTEFYKTAYKVGKAFLLGIIPVSILIIVVEGSIHFNAFAWLDYSNLSSMYAQLPILIVSAIVYILSNFLAYGIAKNGLKKSIYK